MNSPLITVIVPVYKAEPYLSRCVESIRNQTYSNLEIILINDGSPDRCGEMCDAFATADQNQKARNSCDMKLEDSIFVFYDVQSCQEMLAYIQKNFPN